jgi:hypothetical protein
MFRRNINTIKIHLWLLPALAALLCILFMHIPQSLNFKTIIFLSALAILDRLNSKIFADYYFSFFLVTIGLLIFDNSSIFYSLFYFLFDYFTDWVKRKSGFFQVLIPSISINIIIVTMGNEFYECFNPKSYLARYFTLLFLLFLNILSCYILHIVETKKLNTSLIVNASILIVFETLFIFPLVAFFNYFNYMFILLLFLFYYFAVGFAHLRFTNTSERHVQHLVQHFSNNNELDILFLDMDNLKGICNPSKNLIVIDNKMDYPEQLQTLVHEYYHFVLWGKIQIPRFLEEIVVTFLEAIGSWYYILTLNIQ